MFAGDLLWEDGLGCTPAVNLNGGASLLVSDPGLECDLGCSASETGSHFITHFVGYQLW